jgi:hypothetical protein
MHRRLFYAAAILAFLPAAGRGESSGTGLVFNRISEDTLQISVTFPDPVFLPGSRNTAPRDSTIYALRRSESFYLESASESIELVPIGREKNRGVRPGRTVISEDAALDETGITTPLQPRLNPPLIRQTDLGTVNGRHLVLVRLNPLAESVDGPGFQWIERLDVRCIGRGINEVPANALKTGRITAQIPRSRMSKSGIPGLGHKGPALKIWVEKEGLYVIPQSAIVESGWEISKVDPRNLHLFGMSGEIPIRITGQEDGTFDFTDAVEFYGEPLWNTDKPGEKRLDVFAVKNVYWLEAGDKPGLRMSESPVGESSDDPSASFPRSFPYTNHEERDNSFARFPEASPAQMDDPEYWTYTGRPAGGQSIDLVFQLENPDIYSTRPVRFRIKFRGQSNETFGQTVNQPIDVLLNNHLVLSDIWKESGVYVLQNHEFSPAFLFNATNVLTVVNRSRDGELSRVSIDWFEIEFPKRYAAVRNYIRFRPPEPLPGPVCPFKIEGFEQPDVDIYKIGFGRITGHQVSSVTDSLGKTTYTVTFQDRITEDSTEYVALTTSAKRLPDSIAFIPSMGLRAKGRGADYVMIVPSDSLGAQALGPLKELRQKQNLQTEIVPIDSIFNEFNGGIAHPKAIRSFLAYAKSNWNPAPRFVLLVGDGEFNYRAVSASGHTIPVPLYQSVKFGAAASDFWYTLLDDDAFPDIAIGRLPVGTRAELETAVEKIVQYEASPADPWKNRYLMIGAGTKTDNFGVQSNTLIQSSLPYNLHADRMFLVGDPSDPQIGGTQKLGEYFDSGVGWINFRGHGGGGIWADAGLLDLDNARELQNKGRYPFITSMTCFTGDFSGSVQSLGEVLVNQKDGGAVAFMGSSSVGWVTTDYYFIRNVMETASASPGLTIGEVLQQAKTRFAVANENDLTLSEMHQYNLIGDPALRLTFPPEAESAVLDRRSYSESDSLRIHCRNEQGNDRFLFEIVDSENRVHESLEMDLPVSAWDAALPLPPGFREKKAGLRMYAWNEASGTHDRSYVPFAVESSFFDSVMTRPDHPTSRDSIRFQALISDRAEVRGVTCEVFEPVRASLPMVRGSNRDFFASREAVGPFPPGTSVRFLIAVASDAGISESDTMISIVSSLPDLSVYSLTLGGTDRVMLQVTVQNSGQESAEDALLRFESPESGWMAGKSLSIPGGSQTVAGVPFDTRRGKQWFRVTVNPDSSLLESSYGNNQISREIMINAFNVTPENGSCLGAEGPDTVGIAPQGRVPYAGCLIPPGAVEGRRVLMITSEIRIDETLPDPEAQSQVVHRFEFSGFPQDLVTLKDLMLIFSVRSLQDASGTKPYQWIPSLKRWVSVPFSVSDTVFTVVTRTLGTFSLMRTTDDSPPSIEVQMENQVFSEGCYVPERPVFSIHLEDPSGLDFRPDKIGIFLDEIAQPENTYSVPDSARNAAHAVISYRPELSKGAHTLSIKCGDVHGNVAQTETYHFQVSERFDVQFLGNHPNPFKRETIFAYVLTENADRFSIKLYTVSGKRIRVFEEGDLTSADYHEVEWDGKDEWGDEIANGVYFYRITAVKGGDRREITGKIARVR